MVHQTFKTEHLFKVQYRKILQTTLLRLPSNLHRIHLMHSSHQRLLHLQKRLVSTIEDFLCLVLAYSSSARISCIYKESVCCLFFIARWSTKYHEIPSGCLRSSCRNNSRSIHVLVVVAWCWLILGLYKRGDRS